MAFKIKLILFAAALAMVRTIISPVSNAAEIVVMCATTVYAVYQLFNVIQADADEVVSAPFPGPCMVISMVEVADASTQTD